MSGGGAEAGVKGVQAVVVAGHNLFGGDADGGLGGGTDRGGAGYKQDGYRDGLSRWEDNIAHINLGTEPNDPLAYALVLELHHPIITKVGEHKFRLERNRERALQSELEGDP